MENEDASKFPPSRIYRPEISLAGVFQNEAFGADHPDAFFRGGKSIEIRPGAALLRNPAFPPVTRPQDRPVPADYPAVFVVRECYAEEILRGLDRHPLPRQAGVRRSEDRPFVADHPGVLFAPRFDVVEVVRRPAGLPLPGAASVIGVKDRPLRADDPAALVVYKSYVNQLFPHAALLPPPGRPGCLSMQDSAGVADDPALLLVRKGHAIKRRHVVFPRPGGHG